MTCQTRKSTGVTNNLNDGFVLFKSPVRDSESAYQDPDTGAANWDLAIINFIIHTCDFVKIQTKIYSSSLNSC